MIELAVLLLLSLSSGFVMTHSAGTKECNDKGESSPVSEPAEILSLLFDALYKGKCDGIPSNILLEKPEREELEKLLAYVKDLQTGLQGLAKGDFTVPSRLRGYSGGLLKALQSNLRHLIWKSDALAGGNFSQRIDFMGDVSISFNGMAQRLELAHKNLTEHQQRLELLYSDLQQEVEARKKVEKELRNLATTDMLTGIANRRHFLQLARREMERMRRSGAPAALAMLDIDRFKTINDVYGHQRGDAALCSLAGLLSTMLRAYDIPARYGGDEFIIFFPDTSLEVAYTVLERLRLQVNKEKIIQNNAAMPVTISAGVAGVVVAEDDEIALEHVIAKADRALYASKREGRNRVSLEE